MGNKTSKSWLLDVLAEQDLEDLEKGIFELGSTLMNVRRDIIEELRNEESSLFTAMQVNLANGLQACGKKHENKEEKKKYFERYEKYKDCVEDSKDMARRIVNSIAENFFPVEIDSYEELAERHLEAHFARAFETKIPEVYTKATRRVIKTVILEYYRRVKKALGVDVFSLNKQGDNAMIKAIKAIGTYTPETNEQGECENPGEAENWDRACRNLVKLLASAGAVENPRVDSDATCSFGWSALIWAACVGSLEMLEILVKSTADIDYKDRFGRTALYFACEKGNTDSVKLLLAAGANPNITNKFGETAKTRAVKFGHAHISELLGDVRPEGGPLTCKMGCMEPAPEEFSDEEGVVREV